MKENIIAIYAVTNVNGSIVYHLYHDFFLGFIASFVNTPFTSPFSVLRAHAPLSSDVTALPSCSCSSLRGNSRLESSSSLSSITERASYNN